MFPFNVKAEIQPKIEYSAVEYQALSSNNVAYPNYEFVESSWERIQAAASYIKSQTQGASYGYCSCAAYLEAKFPQISGIGLAKNWPINAKFGDIGEIIVFGGSYAGHVALITGFTADGWIVDEANYVHCTHTTNRIVAYDNPAILGYWIPN